MNPDTLFRRLRVPMIVAAWGAMFAAGCIRVAPAPRKPALYRVVGRVIDAETKQGVAQARLRLSAVLSTAIGNRTLVAYAVTAADGKYEVELSEGIEVVRQASRIRLDVAKRGYLAAGIDVPPPAGKQAVQRLPDVQLTRGQAEPAPPAAPLVPGVVPRRPVRPSPLPWKN